MCKYNLIHKWLSLHVEALPLQAECPTAPLVCYSRLKDAHFPVVFYRDPALTEHKEKETDTLSLRSEILVCIITISYIIS